MPAIEKGKTEEDDKTILHIEMTGEPSPCPSCGSSEVVGFGKRTQSVADIPENGKPVVLQVITRRFRCKNCGRSFYESVEGVRGSRRMTDSLADWIRNEAPSRRFTEIAAESGLSEGTVRALLRASGDYERRKREQPK
jgi:transposase